MSAASLLALAAAAVALSAWLAPAHAGLAEDSLARADRWDRAGATAPGDTYAYRVCVERATCFDVVLENAGPAPGGTGFEARLQDRLGHGGFHGGNYARVGHVSGEVAGDQSAISYDRMASSGPVTDLALVADAGWTLRHSPGYYTDPHYALLEETLLFMGAKVRIGDGRLLQYYPVLRVGEQWDRDGEILVTGRQYGYEFGGTSLAGMLYRVGYVPGGQMVQMLVHPGFPFPVSGTMTASTMDAYRDPNVGGKFWFRLIGSSHPSVAESPGGLSEAVPKEPEPAPAPPPAEAPSPAPAAPDGPPLADAPSFLESLRDLQTREDVAAFIEDYGIEDLYAMVMSYLRKVASEPLAITLEVSGDAHRAGDPVTLFGHTPMSGDATVTLYSPDGDPLQASTFPALPPGYFSEEIPTSGLAHSGRVTATLAHGGASASAAFTLVDPAAEPVVLHGRAHVPYASEGAIWVAVEPGMQRSVTLEFPRSMLGTSLTGEALPLSVSVGGEPVPHDDMSGPGSRILAFEVPGERSIVEVREAAPEPPRCSGVARCATGTVAAVIDGDTVRMLDGTVARFALASAPELSMPGGAQARDAIREACPPGSTATLDEDDGQLTGSYGRMVAKVTCNGAVLNEYLLDVSGASSISWRFCQDSEFRHDAWAVANGC